MAECRCEFCAGLVSTSLLEREAGRPVAGVCGRNERRAEDFYDLKKLLGRGASGEVFEARRRADGAQRAVKLIPRLATAGNVFLDVARRARTVENEVACWARLRHPHVVMLDEVFRGPTHFAIVQELVTGGELFERIVTRNHYSEADAAKLLAQILEAVQHVHSRGVIHRDIKPENLLLETPAEDAGIKLADFGLAALESDERRLHKPVGTPGYLAPEVVRCMISPENAYGRESDVWSIGVVLYILLSGSPPFDLEDENVCFQNTLVAQYSFPDVVWGDVSEVAKDLVRKILVADPAQRLTIAQIWEHPFMHGQASERHLHTTLESLARFNARKAWRVGIKAVMAASRFGGVFSRVATVAAKARQQQQQQQQDGAAPSSQPPQ